MTSDGAGFYAERDRRTVEYGVAADRLFQPVRIAVGDQVASSVAGQAAVLALVNMTARVHRRLELEVPAAPLVALSLVDAPDLQSACVETALAIDPYIGLDVRERGWEADGVASVGIGHGTRSDCHFYVGADGWSATLGAEPQPFEGRRASMVGANLAAVLGAASLMQRVFGRQPDARRVSLWRFAEGTAEAGPEGDVGPLDVGDVLVVGAGAVSSAFFYWGREIGLVGEWEVADGDRVFLHNTNRAMTFTAADAGWPGGIASGPGRMKVEAVAPGLNVRRFAGWYENWRAARGDRRPDLVIPLANDFDVRTAIGQRGENLLVHATTSPSWSSQLHRHVAGLDDCIDCRLPADMVVRFDCSEGPLPPDSVREGREPTDAALPFLSAGAGLMLLAGLLQLQAGELVRLRHNHWRLDLALGPRHTLRGGVHTCREGCSRVLSPEVRRVVNAGTRWANLSDRIHVTQP